MLNELGKEDKIRGLSVFRNEFKGINYDTGAQMLDSIYHMTLKTTFKLRFCVKKNANILPYTRDVIMDVITSIALPKSVNN